jgi:hypothetical protein
MPKLILAAALVALVALPAMAQDGSRERRGDMRNATIEKSQMLEREGEMFKRMDVNGDGFLSAEDRQSAENRRAERMKQRMDRMDTDKDGKISQAEFRAGAEARFDRADANKDGKLTPEERRAMRESMGGKRG